MNEAEYELGQQQVQALKDKIRLVFASIVLLGMFSYVGLYVYAFIAGFLDYLK